MPGVGAVHADLVLAAGDQPRLDDGGPPAAALHDAEPGFGPLPAAPVRHRDGGLLRAAQCRGADGQIIGPGALDDGEIPPVDLVLPVAEQFLQIPQHRRGFGDHDQAGGFAVQAVDQLQVGQVGPRLPQGLDDPGRNVRAPMHCHARGLVDDDEFTVFVNDRAFDGRDESGRNPHGRRGIRHDDVRQPQFVAALDAVVLLDLRAVDADFALPHQAEQQGRRHPLELGADVLVQAATIVGFRDGDRPCLERAPGRFIAAAGVIRAVGVIGAIGAAGRPARGTPAGGTSAGRTAGRGPPPPATALRCSPPMRATPLPRITADCAHHSTKSRR